jgi:Family of unknown function (DUF5947)
VTDVRDRLAYVEGLLSGLDGRAVEAVAALASLYGDGLARIIAAVSASGDTGLLAALTEDDLVANLLQAHDLYPEELGVAGCGCRPEPVPVEIRPLRKPDPEPEPETERCELCSAAIGDEHRHLLEIGGGELRCVCVACSVLFDRADAGGGHYRAVPVTRRRVVDFDMDDVSWASLDVPVGLAFFVDDGAGKIDAWYPNPLGMTHSEPDAAVWGDLRRANPVLDGMEPQVEALLVNRRGDEPEHWVVPVDVCYRMAALVRQHWQGFTGGPVWAEISSFFESLRRGARLVDRNGAAVRAAPVS